jgi:hypothetical protein
VEGDTGIEIDRPLTSRTASWEGDRPRSPCSASGECGVSATGDGRPPGSRAGNGYRLLQTKKPERFPAPAQEIISQESTN